MMQLVCERGHVTDHVATPPDQVVAHICQCRKVINLLACGARATWKRSRPAIAEDQRKGP